MIDYTFKAVRDTEVALIEVTTREKSFKKQQKKTRITGAVIGFCFLALGIFTHSIVFVFGGALFMAFAVAIIPYAQRNVVKKKIGKLDQRAVQGDKRYRINDKAIERTDYSGTANTKWDAITEYGNLAHYFWLFSKDQQIMLFDKDKMTDVQFKELKSYAEKYVAYTADKKKKKK